MSVVLAAAVYLPAARCFALVPLISSVRRSGRPEAAVLDYDADRETVMVTAGADHRCLLTTRHGLIMCGAAGCWHFCV